MKVSVPELYRYQEGIMARRTDGTSRRYEFQVFDNPQGRAIAGALDDVQASGGSAADFIREALMFYIQHQAAPLEPAPPTPKLQQEINALWKALAQTSRAAPGQALDGASEAVTPSSGLDLSSPRRKIGSARAVSAEPFSAVFDRQEAQRQLLASIKAYGQVTREGYRG